MPYELVPPAYARLTESPSANPLKSQMRVAVVEAEVLLADSESAVVIIILGFLFAVIDLGA